MDKIDWSKAPEDAEYCGKQLDGTYRWYKDIGVGYSYFNPFFEQWVDTVGQPIARVLISRPQFRNSEHQDHKEGEGVKWVPGTECEIHVSTVYNDDEWRVHTIKAATDHWVVFGGDVGEWCHRRSLVKIRPIQSHRDKCIEAATKVLNEMQVITTQRFISELYDAGCLRLPNDKEGE